MRSLLASSAPLKAVGRSSMPFVHLRVHSAYSLLEGALPFDKIISHALKDQSPAIALTDTRNLFGALEFSQKASEKGLQPLIGIQMDICFADEILNSSTSSAPGKRELFTIILIAATESGYHNLMQIISAAYLESSREELVFRSDFSLQGFEEGLICLTGGLRGPIGLALMQSRHDLARKRLLRLRSLFSNRLYVELERLGGYDRSIESATIQLAFDHGLPLVGVNEAFFETEDDFEAHDALLAISEGSFVALDDRRRVSPDNRLKSSDEMHALFSDIPEALKNTLEIARRCSFYPCHRAPILPRFISGCPDGVDVVAREARELACQAREGLGIRLQASLPAPGYTVQQYYERLDYELCVIEKMQYAGYFLIVSDFIKWAKSNNIPVGPGRGSGAGSLVAYATTITDIDPLRFSLLFERFLNPDRVSMPDFDIDFCQNRREEVIRYVQRKYGFDQVGQIITFGTLQARAVLRDVGRVLQMPYSQVDRLCKMIPRHPSYPMSLEKALETEPRFAEESKRDPAVERLLSIARKLEGLYRHASTHAAGIVIADRPLCQLVPMYRDPRSDMPVTQFNMKKVEDAGLVKFDFLGLKTLTILQKSVELVRKRSISIDLARLPLNDPKTYEMLSRGDVVGVFQVESAGMRKALIGMKPDRIEDIIALVALYRPGPIENIPTYNARKNHQENISSIHPKIDHILQETQGVIIYQEQVMQIAQELAGYSLSEADLLRRAMGKKIRSEMNSQRKRFVSGATERGVEEAQANFIFDLLAKFADYGFNKSHAAAYAILSFQTAYLKAHFPVEFIAASMTLDISDTERLSDFHRDALRLGIEIKSPCVLSSFRDFHVDGSRIFYALSAIKGIGDNAAEHIVDKRGDSPFTSLVDFCCRIDPSIIGKRVFEHLIMSGALDCFGHERSAMMEGVDRITGLACRVRDDGLSGQADIFSMREHALVLPNSQPWSLIDRLRFEFQVIGFYLSAHPLDEYRDFLQKMQVLSWSDFSLTVREGATAGRLAGTVIAKQERKTRTGNKIGIVTFSDMTGQYEAVLFSEVLLKYRDLLIPGNSFLITVLAADQPEGLSLRVQNVEPVEEALNRLNLSLRVYLARAECVPMIAGVLSPGGGLRISLMIVDSQKREIEINLPERYHMDISLIPTLRQIPGVLDVALI